MARAFEVTYADLKPGDVIEHRTALARVQVLEIDKDVPSHWPTNSAGVRTQYTRHRGVAERLKGTNAPPMAVLLDWPVTVYR